MILWANYTLLHPVEIQGIIGYNFYIRGCKHGRDKQHL